MRKPGAMLSPSLPWRLASLASRMPRRCAAAMQTTRSSLCAIGQFAPQALEVAVVLRRHGEARAVVDAVVVEEHAKDFVSLGQHRLGELIGRVRRLMRVRPFVDDNPETQTRSSSVIDGAPPRDAWAAISRDPIALDRPASEMHVRRHVHGLAGAGPRVEVMLGESEAGEFEEPRPADALDPFAHPLVRAAVLLVGVEDRCARPPRPRASAAGCWAGWRRPAYGKSAWIARWSACRRPTPRSWSSPRR